MYLWNLMWLWLRRWSLNLLHCYCWLPNQREMKTDPCRCWKMWLLVCFLGRSQMTETLHILQNCQKQSCSQCCWVVQTQKERELAEDLRKRWHCQTHYCYWLKWWVLLYWRSWSSRSWKMALLLHDLKGKRVHKPPQKCYTEYSKLAPISTTIQEAVLNDTSTAIQANAAHLRSRFNVLIAAIHN